MKKLLSILLVLAMMMTFVSGTFAFAGDEELITDSATEAAEVAEDPAPAPAPDPEPEPEPAEPIPVAAAESVEEPVEEAFVEEELGEEPVAEELSEEPVAEELGEEPVAEELGEEPVAEELGEEPVAEELGEEPVAEELGEEPVAEELGEEELILDGKTNITTVVFNYVDGKLGIASGEDANGVALGAADFKLTSNDDGSYTLKVADKNTYSLSAATFELEDPSVGTLVVGQGSGGNYPVTFTPAGETPTETEQPTESEKPQETTKPSSGGSSSSVSYDKTEELAAGNTAFVVDGYTFGVDRGQFTSSKATITDGKLTVSSKNYINTVATEGGFQLTLEDPPGETCWIYVNESGALAGTAKGTKEAPEGYWTYEDGFLAYHVGDTTYYVVANEKGLTVQEEKPAEANSAVYTGSTKPSKGGGGPKSDSEETDSDAPTFSKQPEAVHFVYKGSDFEAPTYSVTANLPEGSKADGITLQWFVNGEAEGPPETTKGTTASSTITVRKFDKKTDVGVYPVYCQATCTVDGKEHSADSYTTNFIVCTGVQTNSVLTFSDVHEVWNNVGQAVYDTIIATNGLIPALCIATGDYNNSYVAGYTDELINKCIDTMIYRIGLQLGGIDTVWVSGNHDNGYATGFTNANKEADLGLDEENYYDVENGISGTGIIYDSRKRNSADSSLANEGLIVIGINYEDLGSQGAYTPGSTSGRPKGTIDYGTADGPDNTVYKYLETALKNAAKDYSGELVIISTHAGIHALGDEPASTSSQDTDGAYSVKNSAAIVKLVNSFVEEYGMNIMWLFGHDHSRGEIEFYKVPGDTIVSTGDTLGTNETIELKFSYAHAGYITNNIQGHQVYSFLTWDDNSVTRLARVADGKQSSVLDIEDKGEKVFSEKLDFKYALISSDGKTLEAVASPFQASGDVESEIKAKAASLGYEPVAYFDVNPVWSDGTPATKADIPASGLTVVLPLPKDVTSASDIIVLHKDGSIEVFKAGEFIFADDGIRLKVTSLSPFAVAVKSAPNDEPSGEPVDPGKPEDPDKPEPGDQPGDKPGDQPGDKPGDDKPGDKAPDKQDKPPKTGDDTNITVWVAVLVLCGTVVAILPRKKLDR